MAYLNVRERRIEAKIAYVGADLVGKGTNFDQLRQAPRGSRIGKIESASTATDELLSLAWQPPDDGRFRDCNVLVKVVAQRGAVTEARFEDLLRDTDGVVVVIDADPTSGDRNRASLGAVREVLARRDRRDVPVVLQINKMDLPDALAADEVIEALDASAFTHVGASAARGEGVFETLEAALNAVLATLQSGTTHGNSGAATIEPPGSAVAAATPTDGGHPLLAALRQVLRDTVREHVEELEVRITRRLEAKLDALAATSAEEKLAPQIVELLQETDTRVQELAAIVAANTTKDDLSTIIGRMDRLRDEMRSELIRTSEARSRADREHLGTATTTLKRSVDAVSGELRTISDEVRAIDARTQIGQLAERVAEVTRRTEEVEVAMKRMFRVEDAVRGLHAEVSSAVAQVDEKTVAVHDRVNEIVEELKKPKKGWFA